MICCSRCVQTCQWWAHQYSDALHTTDEAQGRVEASHIHGVHEYSHQEWADEAHGEAEDHHERQQHGEGGCYATHAVAQAVHQDGHRKHVHEVWAPAEAGQTEDQRHHRTHKDIDQAQDGHEQGGAVLGHAVRGGVRH